MNKDVIYIEPEDDITDILANIKDAKNKIIALVPPKKAGVLQSAVNFKLIAKTANQHEKTVVLITSDNSLLALADKVKMPTAKTLQSKPKLPNSDSAKEFGDKDEDASDEDAITDDDAEESEEEEEPEEETHQKKAEKTSKKDDAKKAGAVATAKKAKDVDLELDADDVESDGDEKSSKKEKSEKKKNFKVPNFKKYRKFIILAAVLLVVVFGFGYWATAIAPRAKISVKVKTTPANFSQTVSFVTDETKSDPENGVFYAERKETTKKASADFEATGQVDKGTKASGTITVTRPAGEAIDCFETSGVSSFSIPANTQATINGKQYIVTEGGSANVKIDDAEKVKYSGVGLFQRCSLKVAVSSGKIAVVAKEVGEGYNIAATTSGITLNISTNKKYTVTSSAMTGGTSKIVKVVSPEDVEKANNELTGETDKEAREELTSQFSSDYILISNSFAVESSGFTTSPSVNQEVGDGVTPKIARETKYVIYAVKKDDIDAYIRKVAEEKIKGDKTQMVYSTGVATEEDEEDKAFFESYKNENGNMVAKLKSITKTGPRITEDMVKEVSLGVKIGKVQSNLRSYNGVTEANVETSYFWVTSVPNDDNKVEIEITVE